MRLALAMVVAAVGLGGCGSSSSSTDREEPLPVKVDRIPGTAFKRVTLTPFAAQRLGIASVRARAAARGRVSVPYAALLYDPDGRTTAFTTARPFTYVRRPITIDTVRGGNVLVRGGIRPGAAVVVVGADELLGAETGVEGESKG